MSVQNSEKNYLTAKSLYEDITDDFYEIENNKEEDDGYLIDQTLDDIKKINRIIDRINLEELDKEYSSDVMEVLEKNIEIWKIDVYYIERALMSMKLFDKLHPALPKYIKSVNWNEIASNEEDAAMKFGRFLTSEENYKQFKNIVWNIVRGTMTKSYFKKIFNNIKGRISKKKTTSEDLPKFREIPPDMWSEEERKEWYDQLEKRKEQAVPDKKPEFDEIGEKFVSLEYYKKLNS